ncbi:MAG: VWA domain-containing protein [Myxococcaceae bacterium]
MRKFWWLTFFIIPACSCPGAIIDDGSEHTDAGIVGGQNDGGTLGDGGENSGNDAGENCTPPQVLILLDRTGTMHRDLTGQTPPATDAGIASSKLFQAITALDSLAGKPGLDQTMKLGLAFFPQDPGGGACITLAQRLAGQNFSNPACESGQVVIPPAIGTGNAIASLLDPDTTTLCFSTPTGKGLVTAGDELNSIQQAGTKQFVMLVTDGADFYDSCPDPDPMVVLRQLQAAGIDTFVVGFGAQDTTPQGVNPPLLNRMACAGHTAKDFATECESSPDGGYDAVNKDGGTRLYYDAANSTELENTLKSIAAQICCDCIL